MEHSGADVSLSVVMPAYNEEDSILAAVDDVVTHVLDVISGSELVVINDGSTDDTGTLLDYCSQADPRIRILHKINGGHGPAIMSGLGISKGRFVFLIDSDRQIPLDGFSLMWEMAENGKEGVFGVRRKRDDPMVRLWLTALIRNAIAMMFGVRIFDANVPFKLVKRSIWDEAGNYIPEGTLAPSMFLAIYMKRKGYRIEEIDVPHRERERGEVSIKRWKLIKFCAMAFRQMWAFRQAIRDVK